MPASEVMRLYREHKLHSGPGGPIVKKKKQATAIQISMARKEGHDIPKPKGSFQHGGTVPETGPYRVHQGEYITPYASKVPGNYPQSRDIEDRRQWQDIAGRTRAAEEGAVRASIKQSTKEAPWENLLSGPSPTNPQYAVEGLKGSVAERMREQGEAATAKDRYTPGYGGLRPVRNISGSYKHGGTIPRTGIYRLHRGEHVIPASLAKRYRESKHGN